MDVNNDNSIPFNFVRSIGKMGAYKSNVTYITDTNEEVIESYNIPSAYDIGTVNRVENTNKYFVKMKYNGKTIDYSADFDKANVDGIDFEDLFISQLKKLL